MKNQVTFNHIIALFSVIVLPLIVWGVSVEKTKQTVAGNSVEITLLKTELKQSEKSNQENFDEVLEKLQDIQLQLKDKKDRE
jgi:hypothetical protein